MKRAGQRSRIIHPEGAGIEFRIDDSLVPSAIRALTGTTPLDAAVDALPVPARPFWLYGGVRLLRWYRATIAPRLGQRCVFEPSCSHYAELALRRHGFFKGCLMTGQRLSRCRSGAGSTDVP
jgi:putative component of membrane protein insertase Oxa1/YidC/SpoIIIJ protein YidD